MSQPNFAELKRRIRVADAARWLELKLKQERAGLRANCPACQTERTIDLDEDDATPFHCYSQGTNCPETHRGSVIDLVAHVKGITPYEAAQQLQSHFGGTPPAHRQRPRPEEPPPEPGRVELIYEHEMVQQMGIPPATAKAVGIGYAEDGEYAGCVVIPVRVSGPLSGSIGLDLVNGQVKLPKEWQNLPEEKKSPWGIVMVTGKTSTGS